MSEYRRVEESFGESPSARQAGLPAGPGLGASSTLGREAIITIAHQYSLWALATALSTHA